MKEIKNHSWFFILLIFFLTSCYENQEGCQDIFAENFDASADDPCADCCIYPSLSLSISHRIDTLDYSPIYKLYNGMGDSFHIISAGLLISEYELLQSTGTIRTSDRKDFAFSNSNETTNLHDDFTSIIAGSTTATIGDHKSIGAVESVKLELGLSANNSAILADGLQDTHPLGAGSTFRIGVDTLISGFIEVYYDTLARDTVRYTLPPVLAHTFLADTAFTIEYGADVRMNLAIDYFKWVEDINFKEIGLMKDSVASMIVSKLPKSISLNN